MHIDNIAVILNVCLLWLSSHLLTSFFLRKYYNSNWKMTQKVYLWVRNLFHSCLYSEFLWFPEVNWLLKKSCYNVCNLQETCFSFKAVFLIMIIIVFSCLLMNIFIEIAWRLQAVMTENKAVLLER